MSGSSGITFGTGLAIEQQSFTWEIDHFPIILKEDAMINAQRIEFKAGEKIGQLSKWTVYLRTEWNRGKQWISIYYKVKEPPAAVGEFLYSQVGFLVKTGAETRKRTTGMYHISIASEIVGYKRVVNVDEYGGGDLFKIHITFKLFSPKEPVARHPPKEDFESFWKEVSMSTKASKDFAKLVSNPVPGDVKIISSDEKEFLMPKGILAARSPVFLTMFQTDMPSEAKDDDGLIQLPDTSGKTLEILLHFMYTGDLLPGWKRGEVILELTNAAANYQLSDLLAYLDLMLGKVCDLNNVVRLLTLANQLSLKKAEKELLSYFREKGTSSPEDFFEILKVNSGMESCSSSSRSSLSDS